MAFNWQVDFEKESIKVQVTLTDGKQVPNNQNERPIDGKKLFNDRHKNISILIHMTINWDFEIIKRFEF